MRFYKGTKTFENLQNRSLELTLKRVFSKYRKRLPLKDRIEVFLMRVLENLKRRFGQYFKIFYIKRKV
jgi:hypothetical protein